MLEPQRLLGLLKEHGVREFSGVPCSHLSPLSNAVIDDPEVRYVGAANEGDAIAIACGAQLAGVRAAALMQNSGLGNAVNPLTSLAHSFSIPLLLLVSLRGDPQGKPDEPQHQLMGQITPDMLTLMDIPWAYLEESTLEATLAQAFSSMEESNRPFALVVRSGTLQACPLRSQAKVQPVAFHNLPPVAPPQASRQQMLQAILQATGNDVVYATTGFTGRELAALDDRPNHFYMVGSMGCAVSLGLGTALVLPKRRVVVVDGDGALLMRMGALATAGFERPKNLVHILLDNGIHESTGGQATVSRSIDLGAVAAACGYPQVERVQSPDELARLLERPVDAGLTFIHAPTLAGVPAGLPRPEVKPAAVAQRLRQFLEVSQ